MKFDKAEYLRTWHQVNKVRRAADLKERRKNNPERARLQGRLYASKNREKRRASGKRWRDKNKIYNALRMGKYRVKRRSLERAATVNLYRINQWVQAVRARKQNQCYYCENPVTLEFLHFDHIIPISKGGQHSVENLCVSCKKCNQIKSAKLLSEWSHHPQLFLNL